jgi:hypothetical protein
VRKAENEAVGERLRPRNNSDIMSELFGTDGIRARAYQAPLDEASYKRTWHDA